MLPDWLLSILLLPAVTASTATAYRHAGFIHSSQTTNRLSRHAFFSSGKSQSLFCGSLYIDLVLLNPKNLSNVNLHLFNVWAKLWSLGNQGTTQWVANLLTFGSFFIGVLISEQGEGV